MEFEIDRIFGKYNRFYYMGVAITAIFIYHLFSFGIGYYGINKHYSILFMGGYVGVDVFFLLSAYGLCYSLKRGYKSYYLNRFKKLFPLYWLFLSIIFYFFLNLETKETLYTGILHCTGLSSIKALDSNIEWYIPTLILFYILFPVLFKITHRYSISGGSKEILFVIIMVIGCIALTPLIRGINRLPVFIVGILTYIHKQNNTTNRLGLIYVIMAIISLLHDKPFYLIPLILLCISLFCETLPLSNFFSFIGKYTLEIYLAQVVSTKYLMGSGITSNYLLMVGIVIIDTIILSILFHYFQKISSQILFH